MNKNAPRHLYPLVANSPSLTARRNAFFRENDKSIMGQGWIFSMSFVLGLMAYSYAAEKWGTFDRIIERIEMAFTPEALSAVESRLALAKTNYIAQYEHKFRQKREITSARRSYVRPVIQKPHMQKSYVVKSTKTLAPKKAKASQRITKSSVMVSQFKKVRKNKISKKAKYVMAKDIPLKKRKKPVSYNVIDFRDSRESI